LKHHIVRATNSSLLAQEGWDCCNVRNMNRFPWSKLLQQAKKAFGVRLRFRGFSAALIFRGQKI